mmetsp:Transcript_16412/g.40545  ORF Transcript_16412/g.40545 Transcript_16412/m.40545 type:complete len:949 (+) Transcript_16412:95-2941(+)|eukprot:CAMPEP_0178987674 /NCGR_PEP_ID=MMETSP0795-20121207/3393_1 /TAXON_ID=88552 /ORGANISM="Amoebophrya sp., Strain Ameob2" /LENGTH=948 /DNA_ID=CAMNT_0020678877 /DNA_START=85 /DNA_END=2931 /DNA_ORIENTATION=+
MSVQLIAAASMAAANVFALVLIRWIYRLETRAEVELSKQLVAAVVESGEHSTSKVDRDDRKLPLTEEDKKRASRGEDVTVVVGQLPAAEGRISKRISCGLAERISVGGGGGAGENFLVGAASAGGTRRASVNAVERHRRAKFLEQERRDSIAKARLEQVHQLRRQRVLHLREQRRKELHKEKPGFYFVGNERFERHHAARQRNTLIAAVLAEGVVQETVAAGESSGATLSTVMESAKRSGPNAPRAKKQVTAAAEGEDSAGAEAQAEGADEQEEAKSSAATGAASGAAADGQEEIGASAKKQESTAKEEEEAEGYYGEDNENEYYGEDDEYYEEEDDEYAEEEEEGEDEEAGEYNPDSAALAGRSRVRSGLRQAEGEAAADVGTSDGAAGNLETNDGAEHDHEYDEHGGYYDEHGGYYDAFGNYYDHDHGGGHWDEHGVYFDEHGGHYDEVGGYYDAEGHYYAPGEGHEYEDYYNSGYSQEHVEEQSEVQQLPKLGGNLPKLGGNLPKLGANRQQVVTDGGNLPPPPVAGVGNVQLGGSLPKFGGSLPKLGGKSLPQIGGAAAAGGAARGIPPAQVPQEQASVPSRPAASLPKQTNLRAGGARKKTAENKVLQFEFQNEMEEQGSSDLGEQESYEEKEASGEDGDGQSEVHSHLGSEAGFDQASSASANSFNVAMSSEAESGHSDASGGRQAGPLAPPARGGMKATSSAGARKAPAPAKPKPRAPTLVESEHNSPVEASSQGADSSSSHSENSFEIKFSSKSAGSPAEEQWSEATEKLNDSKQFDAEEEISWPREDLMDSQGGGTGLQALGQPPGTNSSPFRSSAAFPNINYMRKPPPPAYQKFTFYNEFSPEGALAALTKIARGEAVQGGEKIGRGRQAGGAAAAAEQEECEPSKYSESFGGSEINCEAERRSCNDTPVADSRRAESPKTDDESAIWPATSADDSEG